MKIQFMSQIPGDYEKKQKAHLHFVPFYLKSKGHNIDVITKKQWSYFYLRYLFFKPDVLIVSGLIGFLPILFKKLGLIRRPVIYYWGDYFHESMGKKWGVDKCAYAEFFCAKNASFVTTPSKFLEKISEIVGIKCKYIPHGVLEGISNIKKDKLKEIDNHEKKLTKFIYIGDIDEYKKTDKIINAVRDKPCILYLIGRVFDNRIMKNLPKNVIYLEEMPHKQVLSYVKACDIAVITSDQDSALKMFEYLGMKKPILAFNGRINYILSHGINAYLTFDFSKGVEELIKNKNLRNHLSKSSKQFKVLTWKEIAQQYEEVITKLSNQLSQK